MDMIEYSGNKKDYILLDIDQKDLADFIGTTRETINKTLN